MAEHGVGGELGEGVRAQGVGGGGADGGRPGEGEPQPGQGGQVRVGVLTVPRPGPGQRAQQGAGAAGRIEGGGGGTRERGHQIGGALRGERVLAGVGVEVTAEQELEGVLRSRVRRELGDGAQQG